MPARTRAKKCRMSRRRARLNRGDKQTIDKAMARAREFIKEYLSSKNLN